MRLRATLLCLCGGFFYRAQGQQLSPADPMSLDNDMGKLNECVLAPGATRAAVATATC